VAYLSTAPHPVIAHLEDRVLKVPKATKARKAPRVNLVERKALKANPAEMETKEHRGNPDKTAIKVIRVRKANRVRMG